MVEEITLDTVNPTNIVSIRQNNPELVVRDCIKEFGLDEKQADRLRLILLARGINKWLLARRMFIRLKHEVKDRLKETLPGSIEYDIFAWLNQEMQEIAKMPRWVEFPKSITHNFKNIEDRIIIKGKRI